MSRIALSRDIPPKVTISAAAAHAVALMAVTLESAPAPIRPITQHLASASGKGVRSSLLFASAVDSQGLVPNKCILAAAAIEIFHLATLVHDDIIDDAATRRGIESVHTKFGKKEAVICGDYLLCLAVSAISTIYEPYLPLAEKFALAAQRVCMGELRQLANNNNTGIGFYEYLRIIHGKTAALFYVSAYAGGLIGQSPQDDVARLCRLGTYMGMMFQILDDCKDYVQNESEAQKPTKTDIATGVVNMPLLMAFLREPALRGMAKSAMGNPMQIAGLIADVHRLEGVDSSLAIVSKYAKKAEAVLDSISCRAKAQELGSLLTRQLHVAKSFAKASCR